MCTMFYAQMVAAPAQGCNKAAAGGDQIGSKKGKDADGDASIPLKAVADGVVTPVTTTDIDSSGITVLTSRLYYAYSGSAGAGGFMMPSPDLLTKLLQRASSSSG